MMLTEGSLLLELSELSTYFISSVLIVNYLLITATFLLPSHNRVIKLKVQRIKDFWSASTKLDLRIFVFIQLNIEARIIQQIIKSLPL